MERLDHQAGCGEVDLLGIRLEPLHDHDASLVHRYVSWCAVALHVWKRMRDDSVRICNTRDVALAEWSGRRILLRAFVEEHVAGSEGLALRGPSVGKGWRRSEQECRCEQRKDSHAGASSDLVMCRVFVFMFSPL